MLHKCYHLRQYDGQADPNRPNNLWEPLPGDFEAHGDFDQRAHKRSWQLLLNMNRRWIALGLFAVGATAAFWKNRGKLQEIAGETIEKIAA